MRVKIAFLTIFFAMTTFAYAFVPYHIRTLAVIIPSTSPAELMTANLLRKEFSAQGNFIVLDEDYVQGMVHDLGYLFKDGLDKGDYLLLGGHLVVDGLLVAEVSQFDVYSCEGMNQGMPVKDWQGEVKIKFRLIDAKTGNTLNQKELSQQKNISYDLNPPGEYPEQAVLKEITRDLVAQYYSNILEDRNPQKVRNVDQTISLMPIKLSREKRPRIVQLDTYKGDYGPEYAAEEFLSIDLIWLNFKAEKFSQTTLGEVWLQEDIVIFDERGNIVLNKPNLMQVHAVLPPVREREAIVFLNRIQLPSYCKPGRYKIKISLMDKLILEQTISEIGIELQ